MGAELVQDTRMSELTDRLRQHLESRSEQLRTFYKYESQLEGWMKGEILWFLDRETVNGRLANFDREVLMPQRKSRKRIDLRLIFYTVEGPATYWIEMKHWLIGYQKDTLYNCQFYFGDPSQGSIKSDVEKLVNLRNGEKYLLILMTANPGMKDWEDGLRKFNGKFQPLHLTPLTEPMNYPEYFFLGLLRV